MGEQLVTAPVGSLAVDWWAFGYCDDGLCALRGMFRPSTVASPSAVVEAYLGRPPDRSTEGDAWLRNGGWFADEGGATVWWTDPKLLDRGEIALWVGDVPATEGGITDCYPLWSEIDENGSVLPRRHACHELPHDVPDRERP